MTSDRESFFERLSKHTVIALLLAAGSLFFMQLGSRLLWDPDEARYAEIPREMLQLRDWITPHLNYVAYFEKPPLLYWLTALSQAVLGQTPFAARFWCAVFGLLTVWVTCLLGKRWKNERVGLLGGSILATSIGFFVLTQFLVLDMVLTFWMTLALYAIAGLLTQKSERERRDAWLLALAWAGGFLTKGPVVLVLSGAVFVGVALYQGLFKKIRQVSWKGPALLFLTLTMPWLILLSLRHPEFPGFFFIHEHFQRFLTNVHQRVQPWYFFAPVLAAGFLPWTVFLPRVLRTWLHHRRAAFKLDVIGSLLVSWTLLVFLFFSASHSKLVTYILPLYPSLALLLAYEFDKVLEEPAMPAWIGRGLTGLIAIFFFGLWALKASSNFNPDPEFVLICQQGGAVAISLALYVFILVGVWGMRRTSFCFGAILIGQVMLLSHVASLAPILDPFHSTKGLADIVNQRANAQDPLVAYGAAYDVYFESLTYHTGRRVIVVGPSGELTFGLGMDPEAARWFAPPEEALLTLNRMPSGTWGVTDSSHWTELRESVPAGLFQPIAREGYFVLFRKK